MDKQQFLILGKSARGRALCELINRATAEPGIFTFGELLCLPNVQEVCFVGAFGSKQGLAAGSTASSLVCQQIIHPHTVSCLLQMTGEFAAHKSLLELFCYGNWSDYQGQHGQLLL